MAATKFFRVEEDVYDYVVSTMRGLDTVSDALRRLLALPSPDAGEEKAS